MIARQRNERRGAVKKQRDDKMAEIRQRFDAEIRAFDSIQRAVEDRDKAIRALEAQAQPLLALVDAAHTNHNHNHNGSDDDDDDDDNDDDDDSGVSVKGAASGATHLSRVLGHLNSTNAAWHRYSLANNKVQRYQQQQLPAFVWGLQPSTGQGWKKARKQRERAALRLLGVLEQAEEAMGRMKESLVQRMRALAARVRGEVKALWGGVLASKGKFDGIKNRLKLQGRLLVNYETSQRIYLHHRYRYDDKTGALQEIEGSGGDGGGGSGSGSGSGGGDGDGGGDDDDGDDGGRGDADADADADDKSIRSWQHW